MSFETRNVGKLEVLTSTLIDVPHGFSTRFGGVSTGYLSSLNLGTSRGDLPENVRENYAILGAAIGFSPEDTVFAKQVHGDVVAPVGRSHRGQGLFTPVTQERDGLVTNAPGVFLTIFTADCVPVLLYDPVSKTVAGVHAGWRGTALGIVRRAVETMCRDYGADPRNIRAAIGPSIGPCCFETHNDVPDAMAEALGQEAWGFITRSGEKFHVDLKGINAHWLRKVGVEQIDICRDCTACQPDRFWSHRITRGERGSLAAIIGLPEERR